MDWRFFGGGLALIAAGSAVGLFSWSALTTGPLEGFNAARGFIQVGTLMASIGVLLTLVSFGLGRRKRRLGGSGSATYKPSETP